jgi:SSS family solute:Na+ symporter
MAVDTPVKLIDGFTYTQGSFLWVINNIYFQYYSLVITVVCILVMIIVSHATQVPDYAKISGLTFGTVTDEHRKESRASWSRGDVIASVVVVILIIMCYLYFTG